MPILFFCLGGGGWVLNIFGDRPIKVAHFTQKKRKRKKKLKAFVFWDAIQPN